MKKIFVFLLCLAPFFFTSCLTTQILQGIGDIREAKREMEQAFSDLADATTIEIPYVLEDPDASLDINIVEVVGNTVQLGMQLKEEFTPENNYYLGRSIAAHLLESYKLYRDDELTEYLNNICETIIMNSEDPYLYNGYHVGILDTDEVNAIGTMGGHILITRGLLRLLSSEDEIAAVIAHEVAHIQLKHSLEIIIGSRFATSITTFFNKKSVEQNVISMKQAELLSDLSDFILENIIQKGFSCDKEFEADELASILMKDSGYDTFCMLTMLEELKSIESKETGWIKNHPEPQERIDKLAEVMPGKVKVKKTAKEAKQKRFDEKLQRVKN